MRSEREGDQRDQREELHVSATLSPIIRVRARQGRVWVELGQGWAWVAQLKARIR